MSLARELVANFAAVTNQATIRYLDVSNDLTVAGDITVNDVTVLGTLTCGTSGTGALLQPSGLIVNDESTETQTTITAGSVGNTDNTSSSGTITNSAVFNTTTLAVEQIDTSVSPSTVSGSVAAGNIAVYAEDQLLSKNASLNLLASVDVPRIAVSYENNNAFQNFLLFLYNGVETFRYDANSIAVAAEKYFSGNLLLPTTTATATFSGTTLTVAGVLTNSFRNYSIGFQGRTNIVNTLTVTNMPVNGRYEVAIYNGGDGNVTINSSLGANVRTTYGASVVVPSSGAALMVIRALSFTTGGTQFVVSVELLN